MAQQQQAAPPQQVALDVSSEDFVRMIGERDVQIFAINRAYFQAQQTISTLSMALTEKDQKIADLSHENMRLKSEVDKLQDRLTSTSVQVG
jgi:predicted  nucleic acid-binding Zn-ribbon protein